TGVKIGFNWQSNRELNIPTHNSVTILFDESKGKVAALIESGEVNAYRTAAAGAVATDTLARKNAGTLTLIGAGHQAYYNCMALTRIRTIEKVWVVGQEGALDVP